MSTTTTTPSVPLSDIPLPSGVDRADEWQDDVPMPYGVLFGELRGVDGLDIDRVSVQPTAVQSVDGRIDDGSLYEAPSVYLGDGALTTRQARDLAAALLNAADVTDGWVQR